MKDTVNLIDCKIGDHVIKVEKTNGDASWMNEEFEIIELGKKYAKTKCVSNGMWENHEKIVTGDWLDGWERKAELDTAEFEVGDRVKTKNGLLGVIVAHPENVNTDKKFKFTGFQTNGDWVENVMKYSNYGWEKATDKEWGKALIKEAERRGVKMCEGEHFEYMPKTDTLMLRMENGIAIRPVYDSGEWKKTENTTFFDWDVEYRGEHVWIAPDCENGFTFTKYQLQVIKDALTHLDSDLTIHELKDELKKLDL